MPDTSLSIMLLYFAGALGLGVAGVLAVGTFVEVHKHFNRWLLPLVIPMLLLAMGFGVVLSQRDITNAETEIGSFGDNATALQIWLLRLVMLFVLGICVAVFLSVSQRHEATMRQGRSLFVGFLLFFVTNNVLNNLFGTNPLIDQKLAYSAVIFAAAFFSRNKDVTPLIDATKWSLLLFMAGSCAAAAWKPSLAIQPYAEGVLPGLPFRMWGLGSNPNSIGPLALVLLLLLAHRPLSSRLLQLAACAVALCVLVLAQSKTAWGATLLAFPVLWWGKMSHAAASRAGNPYTPYPLRSLLRPILVCLLGLAIVLALLYATLHVDQVTKLTTDKQVTTLTGRTEIWAAAIRTWQDNPLFGYGSTAWDSAFRERIGMGFAYSAHNQFLQSLSTAGLVGLIGLIVYLLLLLPYAFAANRATRGLSLALAATIFTRFFTEVPLTIDGVFSGDFITHLLLFSVILTKGRQPVAAQAAQSGYGLLHQFPQR